MSYHFRNLGHHLDALPDELPGIVLPTPSQAARDVPAASSAHCTAHSVLGDGAGVRMQHESHLEIDISYILNSVRNVASMQEQVIFHFGWAREKQKKHIFDVVVTLTSGERIAFAVKPEIRLYSSSKESFEEQMQAVTWWAYETNFVDEVRILTEVDLDPVDQYNAKVMAAVRAVDIDADNAAQHALRSLPAGGGLSLRELTSAIGLGARGYRALIRLLRAGEARLHAKERISPDAVIVNARDEKLIPHLPDRPVLVAEPKPALTVV
ncbi:hypothetical protein [Sulfitobacter sp. R18_1]|uniref:hypothetical protein n=1 Tax=Sulfitobacter sp. R18_1 TaxID=2821104 RepID=UPI001ADB76C9|nr:hypothetical protein [Sulfitobacter sp. R18_1]MBO9429623.1 hypothetical protein [Sulfitobacter sp. R18_1]